MHKSINILVADRNARIREFLKRELTTESCSVFLAGNAGDVIKKIYKDENLDLLILDPELPCTNDPLFCRKLKNRIPLLPVVLHVSHSEINRSHEIPYVAAVIEKEEDSIGKLKELIHKNEKLQKQLQTETDQHV